MGKPWSVAGLAGSVAKTAIMMIEGTALMYVGAVTWTPFANIAVAGTAACLRGVAKNMVVTLTVATAAIDLQFAA